jgi:hypothetical protein
LLGLDSQNRELEQAEEKPRKDPCFTLKAGLALFITICIIALTITVGTEGTFMVVSKLG